MVLSWVWTIIILFSIVFAVYSGQSNAVSAATAQGAQNGIMVAIGIAGSICLWSGVGNLMEKTGMTALLSRLLRPLLHFIFPGTKKDPQLARDLSSSICANILGLGNAGLAVSSHAGIDDGHKDSTFRPVGKGIGQIGAGSVGIPLCHLMADVFDDQIAVHLIADTVHDRNRSGLQGEVSLHNQEITHGLLPFFRYWSG